MKKPKRVTSYFEFRAKQWEAQGGGHSYNTFDFGNNRMRDKQEQTEVFFQPKTNLFFKDIWHCPSVDSAKEVARSILAFPDVYWLEFKGRWVYVHFTLPLGENHFLDGQKTDDRKTYRTDK